MKCIAGHAFDDETDRCSCGIYRPNLKGVRRKHIGYPGWCHTGNLTEDEYIQIMQDQPPPRMRGVVTISYPKEPIGIGNGTAKFYHDCHEFDTEIVTLSVDKITLKGELFYIGTCSKCDQRGLLDRAYPYTVIRS